ncbi:MAG: hypothetical protein ACXIUD_09820 [Mongoliitalea sp.]
MSGFGIVVFDQLFEPIKANPVNSDRLFGFDSEGNVNAAFTISGLRQVLGGGDWNSLANRPNTFAPSAHTLASHSDTFGLGSAPDGVIMAKVAGKWRGITPDFARIEDIPEVSSWVLQIQQSDISKWNQAHSWGDHAGLYRPANWQPGWDDIQQKPSSFTPSSHPLSSHSDAGQLANAQVGQLARFGANGWEAWTAEFYSPSNLPPADASVPDFVRDLDPVRFSLYDDKLEEFVGFPDGSMPMIVGGRAVSSGLEVRISVNPFDEELEPEDFENWEPEVLDFRFTRAVRGVEAVEADEFVTKSQLDQVQTDFSEKIEITNPSLIWVFSITGQKKPSVETYNHLGQRIHGKEHIEDSLYIIEFSSPQSGFISLN